MTWTYQGNEVTELPPDIVGFVYIITNNTNNKKYIGKKLAFFSKTSYKTVTLKSGVKKKKKIKKSVESDWRTYWSSSSDVQNDVKLLGEHNFTREILHFCNSKGTLSYKEAQEQFDNHVLELPDLWYNGIINCRIHRKHLKL